MKNTNEKINAKEYEAVALTDEDMAQVSGGFSYTPISIDCKYEGEEVNTKF